MGDARPARTTRMYATVTWSVPVLVAAVPAATFVAVGLWGLAGAGLVLAVFLVAALVGLRPPGVAAGLGSAVVVASGTALAGLVLVVVVATVLS